VRAAIAQRNHIGCALGAFLRLEQHLVATGVSWWEARASIIRAAVRLYLAHPRYTLASTAYVLTLCLLVLRFRCRRGFTAACVVYSGLWMRP
jgi:hypothetical protein